MKESILKELEFIKKRIDNAIKNTKQGEYWSPQGDLYQIMIQCPTTIHNLKHIAPDIN